MIKKITVFLFLIIASGIYADVEGPRYISSRAMSMGGTYVAVTDNRNAIYSNPAGLNSLTSKLEVSFPSIGFNYNPNTFGMGMLTQFRIGHFTNPGAINKDFINDLHDVEGKHIMNTILPEFDFVLRNLGLGVYGASSLDAVYDAGIYEPKLTYSSRTDVAVNVAASRRIFRPLSLGINAKYILRLEAPQTTVWGRNIGTIKAVGLFSNPDDTLSLQEKIKQGYGIDVGTIVHMGFFRIGGVLKNAYDVIGDENIQRQLDLGTGYWIPQLMHRGLLNKVVLAADVHDFTSQKNFWTKVHLGAEADLPLGGIRVGINQGYPTWGFNVKFFMFHIEYAQYGQELGEYPLNIPNYNYLLVFRIGF